MPTHESSSRERQRSQRQRGDTAEAGFDRGADRTRAGKVCIYRTGRQGEADGPSTGIEQRRITDRSSCDRGGYASCERARLIEDSSKAAAKRRDCQSCARGEGIAKTYALARLDETQLERPHPSCPHLDVALPRRAGIDLEVGRVPPALALRKLDGSTSADGESTMQGEGGRTAGFRQNRSSFCAVASCCALTCAPPCSSTLESGPFSFDGDDGAELPSGGCTIPVLRRTSAIDAMQHRDGSSER